MAKSESSGASRVRAKRKFPWLALLLLLGSVYLFWVLPRQLPDLPVKVELAGADAE